VFAGITDGTVISHNEIRNLPYTGISIGWQWNPQPTPCANNIAEYNHIHHIMQVLSDGGGIYTLGRQPGTVLRYNYIHDIPVNAGRAESNGCFLDQGSSEFLIQGNTIHSVARSTIRYHQALKLTMRGNNLVVSKGQKPYQYNACSPDTMVFDNDRIIMDTDTFRTEPKGRRGSALLCDGIGSFLEVPHTAELEPECITIEAWIKVDTYAEGKESRQWIVNKNKHEWENGHYALVIKDSEAGAYLNIGGSKNNVYQVWSTTQPLKLDTWHHLAMTFNGKDLTVYVDGSSAGSVKVNKKRQPGSLPFAIGKRQDGYVKFKGLIDEVCVYGQSLTASDIKKRFVSSGKPDHKKLIRFWDFEQKTEKLECVVKAEKEAGLEEPYKKTLLNEK
jgi:hypothetical protein